MPSSFSPDAAGEQAELRAAFEQSRDGIILVDSSGQCTRINPAARDVLGLARDTAMAAMTPQMMLLLAGSRRHVELKTEAGARHVEYSVWRDVLPDRHLIVLRDVTDRMALERQLYLAQRMEAVGRLAGGIAHDFNNILTAVIGFGTLLADHVHHDSTAAGYTSEILTAAERASTLTRQLLAFGRRQVLRPSPLDLGEVAEALAGVLQRVIGEDVAFKLVAPARLPCVRADRAQLEQALLNLVINACDAMPNGGRLTIELAETELDESYCSTHVSSRPGRYVRIAVSDTGVGIDRVSIQQIFEPFFTTKDVGAGSGLGLAMVYGIVKQSGGNIWVYSERGHGTTFKIYLPVDASAEPVAAPLEQRLEATGGTETILLVEDAPHIRQLAREVLARAGYRVLLAGDPMEALEIAAAHDSAIDLLLTDVVMPGSSGTDLARRLCAERSDLRVLFMSGYPDDAVVRNGLLAGDAPFLQKPFTPDVLRRKVRQVLDSPNTFRRSGS